MREGRTPLDSTLSVLSSEAQLGDCVRGFQLGDRVADLTVLGSNAAYRTLRASDLPACRRASTQRRRPR